MVWNLESTLVWNPESRRLESGIQRVEIQNLEAGIRNPGPSWILLHRANSLSSPSRCSCAGNLGACVFSLTEQTLLFENTSKQTFPKTIAIDISSLNYVMKESPTWPLDSLVSSIVRSSVCLFVLCLST